MRSAYSRPSCRPTSAVAKVSSSSAKRSDARSTASSEPTRFPTRTFHRCMPAMPHLPDTWAIGLLATASLGRRSITELAAQRASPLGCSTVEHLRRRSLSDGRSTVEHPDGGAQSGRRRPLASIEELLEELEQALLFACGERPRLDADRDVPLGVLVPGTGGLSLDRELRRRGAL